MVDQSRSRRGHADQSLRPWAQLARRAVALGALFLAGGDVGSAKVSEEGSQTVVTAPIAPAAMRALSARIGKSMPIGLEGAGVVTNAGPSPEAQALLGKTVSIFVGGMYGQLRKARGADCRTALQGLCTDDERRPDGVLAEHSRSSDDL